MIRPARQQDEAALARVNRAALRGIVRDPPPLERLRKSFAARLEREDRILLVAERPEGATRTRAEVGAEEIRFRREL